MLTINNTETDKYKIAENERNSFTKIILDSKSNKKIVVGGPGTGKTHLFQKILEGKTNSVTLTFINALVEDLSLNLCGTSEVRTLHSFARKILGENVKIFPKLSTIIEEDYKILNNIDIDFEKIFFNRDDNNSALDFYKERKKYYGNYYGYTDVIYAAALLLERQPDKIPTFEQILVDEFQDFNKLEVSLIDQLSQKSPILLVGDDDQAIYDFKDADSKYIRSRYDVQNKEYESFALPFCSRSTRTIVNSINNIVTSAQKKGYLPGRINKAYKYFEEKKKDIESDNNPKIIHKHCYERQMPWFIENQINILASEVKNDFSVLIISPTKVKISMIANKLKNSGFKNVDFNNNNDDKEPSIYDGLKILIEDPKSNLGLRIVTKHILEKNDFKKILTISKENTKQDFVDILDKSTLSVINRLINTVKKIISGNNFTKEQLIHTLNILNIDPYEISIQTIRNIFQNNSNIGKPETRKLRIKCTTVQGSKGLAADYVFITHFDDQFLIKDKDKTKVVDQDICRLIVEMTRARRKIYLISSFKNKPFFLSWIDQNNIQYI